MTVVAFILALIIFGWMGWVIYILLTTRNEEPKNEGSTGEYDIDRR